MKYEIAKNLSRFLSHFRYPASLPEDIASDLGLKLSKVTTFAKLIEELSSPHLVSEKLFASMTKEEAEKVFVYAMKKESFKATSLFSYRFNEGWLVVTLYFDDMDALSKVYIQCPSASAREGFYLALSQKRCKLVSSEKLINV